MNTVGLGITALFCLFLFFGAIFGMTRGLKRTLTRTIWVVIVILITYLVSIRITTLLLNLKIGNLVDLQVEGTKYLTLKDYALAFFKSQVSVEGANYDSMVGLIFALATMIVSGIVFLLGYVILKLVSLIPYWITNGIIFRKERKRNKEAKKEAKLNKTKFHKKKHRLAGVLVGLVLGLLSFLTFMTPVVGYVNAVQTIDRESKKYTEDNRGLFNDDTYTMVIDGYNNSVPIKIMSALKLDDMLVGLNDLATGVKIGDEKIKLSKEAVNIGKIYGNLSSLSIPDFKTSSKESIDEFLTDADEMVDVLFDSRIIHASIDVVIPFGVKYVEQELKLDTYKSYEKDFFDTCFEQLETLNADNTEAEIHGLVALVRSVNDADLLVPVVQDKMGDDKVLFLQSRLTKSNTNNMMEALFNLDTVDKVAPALVNYLLGFGAEQLQYEYDKENSVTSDRLEESATTILESAVDVLDTYDPDKTTMFSINAKTVNALGLIFDNVKAVLSPDNFKNVIESVEPKLQTGIKDMVAGLPNFARTAVDKSLGNISEISSFTEAFNDAYSAYDIIMEELDEAKVDDSHDVSLMDFSRIGRALDKVKVCPLFKGNIIYTALKDGLTEYINDFEKSLSTDGKTITFTFDDVLIANINNMRDDTFFWETELPKLQNTIGTIVNLLETKKDTNTDIFTLIKSDTDATLEELGASLDNDLKTSAFFKNCDRLLVKDLLNVADIKFNTDNDESLSTLLGDISHNIDTKPVITWEKEFKHIKSLIKVDFADSSDEKLVELGQTIDSIVIGELKSDIITQDIINKYISDYMDKVFVDIDSTNDFYETINSIKLGFNSNDILSYEKEIEALLKLKSMKTIVDAPDFTFSNSAVEIGTKIDEALAVDNVTIVDQELVNTFLKKVINKNIDLSTSKFSSIMTKITADGGRLDTMATNAYAKEFGHLKDLQFVADNYSNITVDTINAKVNNITLAERFDGSESDSTVIPIRNSYLVGDALLDVIGTTLNEYTPGAEFDAILTEVKNNYTALKTDVYWAGNATGQKEYTDIINAISEIDSALDNQDLVGEVDLTTLNTKVDTYHTALSAMQNNILMQANGTNRLTYHVMTKIKEKLDLTELTTAKNYLATYMEFLNDNKTMTQPYNEASPVKYAVKNGTWQISETDNGGIIINTPVTQICNAMLSA